MECGRVLVSSSLFAGIALSGTAAFADDEGLRLAWTAPAGCPSADDVRSATLRGVDRGKMLSGTLVANASVEQVATNSWRVKLKTQRGASAGEREIEGPTCAGVADATAVVLALALVPPTTLEAPPPEPPKPEAPKPEPERPKSPASPESHHIAAGVAYAGNVGVLPKLGAGGAVSLAWTPGRLRIEADGKLFGAQTPSITAGSARFSLKGIGGRACFAVLRGSSFDVAPCVGFGVEILGAEGVRTPEIRSGTEILGSFGAGGLGRVFLTSWLALRGRVEAIVPLSRPNFIVQESQNGVTTGQFSVFKPPTIGAAGYFGAEVLFL